ncbi:long-chain fatty acid--CoA ligase [Gordonia sp. X0973]|uniref:AMP-dependent synthetase/ligase n=1 Tax=Gordonia sp. X0973 TaxID=2742602 RepID=UPI000F534099|nr:long-chain fatty acid--CoA ligase [Gordonia sp. X0973]QKT07102.1 long-chain fatty acid--CoA ligase [Gordonia sp. X0973]
MADELITFPHASGKAVSTLPEGFQETIQLAPDRVALRTVGGGVEITWRQYGDRVRAIAGGLAALGVKPGDTVAIMMTNRPEFHLADTAALHLGAVPFSIYNTSSPEQIEYLFGNAGNSVVVTESVFLPLLAAAKTGVTSIISVDGGEGAIPLAKVESTPAPDGFDFDASWRAVTPADLATLIYTSGTTGPPKGVEITHRNMIAELLALSDIVEAGLDDRLLSYLPAAHIADRVSTHATNMVRGAQITSEPDPRAIATALPDARPTFFFGVPRVWQKLKAGIEAKLAEATGVKAKLAGWALGVGDEVAGLRLEGKSPSGLLGIQHRLADKLVLSTVREGIGMDAIDIAYSGAASIPPEVLRFFLALGIPVLEVWGMSESTGATTLTSPDNLAIGTVGRPVRGVECKLGDDGELFVRGPVIMAGYRNQPEKTAETIDADGWLATGDVAQIGADGNVKIVDRKKELIINESGKNLAPTNIENAVKAASPLVGQVVALGDGKPYVTALVVLDPDMAAVKAHQHGLDETDLAAISAHPEVVAEVRAAVEKGNAKLSRVEQVKRFVVVDTPWEPGGEELTPTMKLRRNPINAKYADEIVALYSDPAGAGVVDLR